MWNIDRNKHKLNIISNKQQQHTTYGRTSLNIQETQATVPISKKTKQDETTSKHERASEPILNVERMSTNINTISETIDKLESKDDRA